LIAGDIERYRDVTENVLVNLKACWGITPLPVGRGLSQSRAAKLTKRCRGGKLFDDRMLPRSGGA
jgi:hypothetical protein